MQCKELRLTMKPIVIIPARLAAQRFPNKPLADINGKPMILHVMERALEANIGPVAVACCGEEIASLIRQHGGTAIVTDPALPSGTDRVYSAYKQLAINDNYDVVVNLQGDLPFIDPKQIREAIQPLQNKSADVGTLAVATCDKSDAQNPNHVKIALAPYGNSLGKALYFSRAPIPYDAETFYHHVGIYAYRPHVLEKFVSLSPSTLEIQERLEQLRIMEAGMQLHVALTDKMPLSIDAPEDITRLLQHLECTS